MTDQPVVVAPWGLMKKDANQRHLRNEHKYTDFVTRDTVEDLTTKHEREHEESAQIAAGQVPPRWRNWTIENLQASEAREVPHTHGTSAPTEEEAKVLAGIRAGIELDKPLPAGERKLLESLVDNDFGSLRTEMRQMAADTKAARLADVDKEWAAKRNEGPRYVEQVRVIYEQASEALRSLVEQARLNGVTLDVGRAPHRLVSEFSSSFEATGEKEARNKVATEVEADLNRALLALERQRLGAQRIVALSGVTPEAAKVLDTVPDAKGLMIEAAQVRITAAIEQS